MHWFGGCCGGPWFGGWGGAAGLFGMLFSGLLFLGLLIGGILLIVWAVRRLGSGSATVSTGAAPRTSQARQILEERYARGEISREEYLTALADLGEK